MTLNGWLQILLFFVIVLAVTKPLGLFMTHVFNREKTFLDPVLRPVGQSVVLGRRQGASAALPFVHHVFRISE